MFIDGEVDAVESTANIGDSASLSVSNYRDGAIKTFISGQCIGEECFEVDDYKL